MDVNNFNQSFAAYAGRQGIAYNESLAALHRETERLQEQINLWVQVPYFPYLTLNNIRGLYQRAFPGTITKL